MFRSGVPNQSSYVYAHASVYGLRYAYRFAFVVLTFYCLGRAIAAFPVVDWESALKPLLSRHIAELRILGADQVVHDNCISNLGVRGTVPEVYVDGVREVYR